MIIPLSVPVSDLTRLHWAHTLRVTYSRVTLPRALRFILFLPPFSLWTLSASVVRCFPVPSRNLQPPKTPPIRLLIVVSETSIGCRFFMGGPLLAKGLSAFTQITLLAFKISLPFSRILLFFLRARASPLFPRPDSGTFYLSVLQYWFPMANFFLIKNEVSPLSRSL